MPSATPSAALFHGAEMLEPQGASFLAGDCQFFCCASPFAKGGTGGPNREPNQDALALMPFTHGTGILVVADGVGGMPGGEHASARALTLLADSLVRAAREERSLRDGILDGFEAANRGVLELGGGATTLAVAEVGPDWVRSYHVGDSVVLVADQGGVLRSRTVPHSPIGSLVEAGVLDEQEAMQHEHLHLINNVVGSSEMRIEIGPPVEFGPEDTLLLASDGLMDNLYLAELVACMRSRQLADSSTRLLSECRQRMRGVRPELPSKPDDLAFMLYRRAQD